jgi:hypothetical protein
MALLNSTGQAEKLQNLSALVLLRALVSAATAQFLQPADTIYASDSKTYWLLHTVDNG